MSDGSKALLLAFATTLFVCMCCACAYDLVKEIL